MKNKILTYLITIITLGNSSAFGETTSLHELATLATINADDLKAIENDIKSWQSLSEEAGMLHNPNIYFGFGPSRQNGEGGARGELGIKQPIPLWGKQEVNADINNKNKEISEIELKTLQLNKEALLIKASYKLVELRHELEHYDHREKRFQVITNHLNNFPFPSPDKSLEKTLLTNKLALISNKKIPIKADINYLNNLVGNITKKTGDIKPKIKWVTSFKTVLPYAINREDALSNNPNITSAKLNSDLARLNEKQASLKYLPDFSIGTSLGFEQSNGEQKLALLTIDTTLPILNSGKHQVTAATDIVNSKKHEEAAQERSIEQNFERLWSSYQSTKERIKLYPLKEDQECDEKMNEAGENLKKSLISVNNFIELDTQCFEIHNEIYEAQLEYISTLVDLFLLKGESPLEIQELS